MIIRSFFTIDGEGNRAVVTFTEKASKVSDLVRALGDDDQGDAFDTFVFSAVAAGLAMKGFEGDLTFKNYDGTELVNATIDNGVVTLPDLEGQEISFLVDKSQIPNDLGNSLLNQGNKPLEGGTMGITPAQSEGQSAVKPAQSQGGGSAASALTQ